MDPHYRTMIEFLRGLGTEDVTHSGEKGFLAHLVSVFHNLERWGCDRDLCRAGLFHSIYGTELFQRFCVCISVTGWSRSLAPSAGATDESRTIKWRSG